MKRSVVLVMAVVVIASVPMVGSAPRHVAHAAGATHTLQAFGDAAPHDGPPADTDVAGVARHPSGAGVWTVTPAGKVFTSGAVSHHGQLDIALNQPIVGMAATPSGNGYWLVASDGGLFAFGDAPFHGSTGAMRLNRPVVGMAATPSGNGYWLVASDGGLFAFGDARFHGSTGDMRLNEPVVGMAAPPAGTGYWLVARDGGVFSFGVPFHGSTGDLRLAQPMVGMASTPTGDGYWMVGADGGVFALGGAPFHGSAAGTYPAGVTAAGIAPTVTGNGYWVAAGRSAVRILTAGDVHGEGPIRSMVQNGGNPLSEVAGLLTGADVAAVNLETPAASPGTPQPKQYVFMAPVQLLTALRDAGVDVVSLANNHAMDHGARAMLDTITNARNAGLVPVGAGRNAAEAYAPGYVDVRGRRVAFIGLSRVVPAGWAATASGPGVASAYNEAASLNAVRAARANADAVVVMIHWGVELARCPGGDVMALARRLHDAGAHVVAGHHPHVLEGITANGRRTTQFSLGNFVWYHNNPPSHETGVLETAVDRRTQRVETGFHPAVVGDDGKPRLRAGADADAARQRLAALTPGAGCPAG